MLALRKSIVSFIVGLVLLAAVTGCAVTTPEIHAKIVDAETGKPQQWIKVVVYADKKILISLEGKDEKILFTKSFYFHAEDGEIVIPAQHFTILDFVRYKDWKLFVKTTGHHIICFKGSDIVELIEKGSSVQVRGREIARRMDSSGCQVRILVSPYSAGKSWDGGYMDDDLLSYESPKPPRKQIKLNAKDAAIHSAMLIEEYRDLISRWSIYSSRSPTVIMREHGLLGYAKDYVNMLFAFYCSNKNLQLERPGKLLVDADDLFQSLIEKKTYPNEMNELRNRLRAIEKGGCK